jgi:putative NADH-flavin reductase
MDMARVLIIGASKGIGLETTRQALEAGHMVRAFARSVGEILISDPKLEKRRGNALRSSEVTAAVAELFGPVHLFSDATRILVRAMQAQGVKRLISVTGFGAGDSRASISCLQLLPFRFFFGRAYDDKDVQERLIQDSALDWTIVRPGVLTNGSPTGRYKVLKERSQWRNGTIARADVADFLVQEIEDRACVGKKPVLVY